MIDYRGDYSLSAIEGNGYISITFNIFYDIYFRDVDTSSPSARILEKAGMKEVNRDHNLIYWEFI